MADFLILRDLDEPIPERTSDAAAEQASNVLQDLDDEGVGIRWVKSDVRTRMDGTVTGTFCHYQAENEEAPLEHAVRAGLPATRIDLHGRTLENEQKPVSGTEKRTEKAQRVRHTNGKQNERRYAID